MVYTILKEVKSWIDMVINKKWNRIKIGKIDNNKRYRKPY